MEKRIYKTVDEIEEEKRHRENVNTDRVAEVLVELFRDVLPKKGVKHCDPDIEEIELPE